MGDIFETDKVHNTLKEKVTHYVCKDIRKENGKIIYYISIKWRCIRIFRYRLLFRHSTCQQKLLNIYRQAPKEQNIIIKI